ncbi:MAG: AIPR family protein [Candidatus Aenigmatarchaeota archaeon]
MQKTLDNAEDRKFFWYYNLGINAICDKFTPLKNGMHFKNFRIINGAQTCNTLFLNLDKLENVLVLLRVFETKDLDLATRIAISNNTQSPVKGRDLFSEDDQQIRLQKEFDKIRPPVFYERKRKEWDSLWKNKRLEALKYVDKQTKAKRIIDNETCAKGFMALKLKMPAEAKSEKQKIFVLEDFGGYYEKIFNPETTPYHLLVSYKIITFVNEKIAEFTKAYKKLEKNNFQGIKEKDLKYMQKLIEFLPHSDTHITALFGLVFENKYGEDYDFERIHNTVLQNSDVMNKIYEWLRDQLALHIDNVRSAFGAKPFNARNYLVNPKSFVSIENFINTQIKYNKQFLDMLPT